MLLGLCNPKRNALPCTGDSRLLYVVHPHPALSSNLSVISWNNASGPVSKLWSTAPADPNGTGMGGKEMFGNLIESSSHKTDYARRGSFFLGTLTIYALIFLAIGVGSIYAYDTH